LVKSPSIELAPHAIPVNAIARLADPQEIGELIRYLATMQGTFMTGAIIDFSGGWPVATQAPD
jgi:NAD(P)-dependent dehydrogenase (short-subunit alcohol dehydrogenase family)